MMMKNRLRQNEVDCLNKVKKSFIYFRGIQKVFDNSDYLTMESMLNSARQNKNHSEFPDFFFDGGIIERFEVTSSRETKEGSEYKIENKKFQRDSEKIFCEYGEEIIKSRHLPGTIIPRTNDKIFKIFSYEYFINSFKRNSTQHLQSLEKSKYTKQKVIFLIEQNGGRLTIYKDDKFERFYKISDDKNLLKYIKETFIDVDYIIFTVAETYEIIDLSKIDQLINDARSVLDIRPGRLLLNALKLFVNL